MSGNEAEERLLWLLNECREEVERNRASTESDGVDTDDYTTQRVVCNTCNASRSIYCSECCNILLPKHTWPKVIREQTLYLPFHIDIILNDRRVSSTGVQLHTIFTSMNSMMLSKSQEEEDDDDINNDDNPNDSCTIGTEESQQQQQQQRRQPTICRLFDVDRNEEIPNYAAEHDDDDGTGTYLLFPGPNSQPLSSIAQNENGVSNNKIKRLVVLDCKWSKISIRDHKHLIHLPQVHLDSHSSCIPKQSYFWRWHNAGENMLSTIEAIYYAAYYISSSKSTIITQQQSSSDTTTPTTTTSNNNDDRNNIVYIMWLFGLIRTIIQSRYDEGKVQSFIHPPAVPFLESSKEFYRQLRRQQRKGKKNKNNISNDIGREVLNA